MIHFFRLYAYITFVYQELRRAEKDESGVIILEYVHESLATIAMFILIVTPLLRRIYLEITKIKSS